MSLRATHIERKHPTRPPSVNRLLLDHLWRLAVVMASALIPVLFLVAHSRAAERGAGPKTIDPRDRRQTSARDRGGGRQADHAFKLLEEALGVIRSSYVEEISDPETLIKAVGKTREKLAPRIRHDADLVDSRGGDPDVCLRETLGKISTESHLDPEVVVAGFLRTLLQNLDSNSDLLDPTMLQEIEIAMSGKFGGIGMVVASKGRDYLVTSSFEGSPARRAGLQVGDTVMEIDGHPICGLPLPEVLRLVRGRAGSRIALGLKDKETGHVRRLHLVRKVINLPPVRSTMLAGSTGYLRIVNFQQSTTRGVSLALKKLTGKSRSPLKALVVDLRDNPGGLFDQAVSCAELFVESGLITSVRGRLGRLNRDFSVRPGRHRIECPMAILVNKGTASAAEILAGALKGRPNVTIMGRRSFGKASVQGIFTLGGGMAVRLTTARYLTADGSNIDKKGIDPDVVLDEASESRPLYGPVKFSPELVEKDACVRKALAYLAGSACVRTGIFSSFY